MFVWGSHRSSHTYCRGTLQIRWPLCVGHPACPGRALPPAPTSATPSYDHEVLAGPCRAPEGGLLPSASLCIYWGDGERRRERQTGELQINKPNVLCNRTKHTFTRKHTHKHTNLYCYFCRTFTNILLTPTITTKSPTLCPPPPKGSLLCE